MNDLLKLLLNKESLAIYTIPGILLGLGASGHLTNYVNGVLKDTGFTLGSLATILLVIYLTIYLSLIFTNRIIPLRFANLVYIINDNNEFAFINHKFYNKIMPPGKRLRLFESPHQAVETALKSELGINNDKWEFIVNSDEIINYGSRVETVPRPFQVQVESGGHRLGVKRHYDFVYVCKIKGRPHLETKHDPIWITIEKLEKLRLEKGEKIVFPDTIPTMKKILKHIKKVGS